jgi:hypothetical protein
MKNRVRTLVQEIPKRPRIRGSGSLQDSGRVVVPSAIASLGASVLNRHPVGKQTIRNFLILIHKTGQLRFARFLGYLHPMVQW